MRPLSAASLLPVLVTLGTIDVRAVEMTEVGVFRIADPGDGSRSRATEHSTGGRSYAISWIPVPSRWTCAPLRGSHDLYARSYLVMSGNGVLERVPLGPVNHWWIAAQPSPDGRRSILCVEEPPEHIRDHPRAIPVVLARSATGRELRARLDLTQRVCFLGHDEVTFVTPRGEVRWDANPAGTLGFLVADSVGVLLRIDGDRVVEELWRCENDRQSDRRGRFSRAVFAGEAEVMALTEHVFTQRDGEWPPPGTRLTVLEVSDGAVRERTLHLEVASFLAAISPTGRQVALDVGSRSSRGVVIIDVDTGREEVRIDGTHQQTQTSLLFDKGLFDRVHVHLATEPAVEIWDLEQEGPRLVARRPVPWSALGERGHDSLLLSPDGAHVLVERRERREDGTAGERRLSLFDESGAEIALPSPEGSSDGPWAWLQQAGDSVYFLARERMMLDDQHPTARLWWEALGPAGAAAARPSGTAK